MNDSNDISRHPTHHKDNYTINFVLITKQIDALQYVCDDITKTKDNIKEDLEDHKASKGWTGSFLKTVGAS